MLKLECFMNGELKMSNIPIEIERKFIIKLPDISLLEKMPDYTRSEITQIYISSPPAITHRVRKRIYSDKTVCTETKKIRIDKISSYEDERNISLEEFSEIAKNIKDGTLPVIKTRHTFSYLEKTVEIDIYPNWKRSAILEVELKTKEEELSLPESICVLSEVTGKRKYSNASMAQTFPDEII